MNMAQQNTKISCGVCGNDNIIFLFETQDYLTGDYFDVYRCRKCGCGYTYPTLSSEDLKKYYKQTYYGKRKSFTDNIINYLRVRKILNIKSTPGVIVDVGCGSGSFLKEMKKRNWEIFGTEIVPNDHILIDIDKKICKKEFPLCNYKNSSFDIVTMWHSLEHIPDAFSYLLEAKRILKNDGVIIIEVPNFLSIEEKITKNNWFHLDVPRHPIHFTPDALKNLLTRANLKIVKIEHFSMVYGFFGFFQSILNILTKRKNLLFDLLNGKISIKKIVVHHTSDALINAFLFLPIVITSFILFLIEILIKRGGIITISAKNN